MTIYWSKKKQLSRLFETHSPWLICYHLSKSQFIAEWNGNLMPLWAIDFRWQCQYKCKKCKTAKRQNERDEWALQTFLPFLSNVCFSPSLAEWKKSAGMKWNRCHHYAMYTINQISDLVDLVDSWQKLGGKKNMKKEQTEWKNRIRHANSKQKSSPFFAISTRWQSIHICHTCSSGTYVWQAYCFDFNWFLLWFFRVYKHKRKEKKRTECIGGKNA